MNAETPGWGLCMGGSLHTDDGKPAYIRITMHLEVQNEQVHRQAQ